LDEVYILFHFNIMLNTMGYPLLQLVRWNMEGKHAGKEGQRSSSSVSVYLQFSLWTSWPVLIQLHLL